MPTYQYACTACGHQLEAVQSFTDEPLTECPSCQGRLRKVFNSVGIVFKGSGFYRTDSRSGGGSDTAAGKTGGTSESGNGSSTNGAGSGGDSGSSTPSAKPSTGDSGGGTAAAKPAAATTSASSSTGAA